MNASQEQIAADVINAIPENDDPPARNKRMNAAEQFRKENQGLSEVLRRDCTEGVTNVHEHHRTFPRLDEELRKKESLIKVTTIKVKDFHSDFDWNCGACVRLAIYNSLKKSVKPSCIDCCCKSGNSRAVCQHERSRGRPRSRSIRRRKLSGVKIKPSKKLINGYKSQVHTSCQYSNICLLQKANKGCATESNDKINEPVKVDPSVSSYNTFGPLDQEPMDSWQL